MVTVKQGSHKTFLQGFVDAIPHCGNALCIKLFAQQAKQLNPVHTTTLIPFDTRSNAKVEVYVLQEVLHGFPIDKKSVRVTFLHQHASSAWHCRRAAIGLESHMRMRPNKAETAVHGCHCPGDIALCMRKVLASTLSFQLPTFHW